MELMRALALKNNFHYHKDRTQKVETIKLTNNEEVKSVIPTLILFQPSLTIQQFLNVSLVTICINLLFIFSEMAITFN